MERMSRRIVISFSGAAYDRTTEILVNTAEKFGASESPFVYDDAWLEDHEFRHLPSNQWIFNHPGDKTGRKRGICWFAWKPLVILDALGKMQDGDICLYLDADTYPIAEFSMLYDECARIGGIMLFQATGCSNRDWVKCDCWFVMGMDPAGRPMGKLDPAPEWSRDSQHAVARFMLFQKGPWRTQQFLYEWLTYCVNRYATTFDHSYITGEWLDLHEHRTEQAILSLLALKYGIKLYREADAFGNSVDNDKELFGQLFVQEYGAGPRDQLGSRFRRIPT
jgi:hypothetical protein